MQYFTWFSASSRIRGRAMSFYKRGMRKARVHDHPGAIADYSSAIDLPDAPPDVTAMARYNRALVHLAAKDDHKAIDDLNSVIAMNEELTNVKTMARQKLIRIERRSNANGV